VRVFSFRNGGTNIIAEIRIGGSNGPVRDLSVSIGKRSHINLEKQCGRDLSQWGGKIVELYVNDKWVNVAGEDEQINYQSTNKRGKQADDDNVPF
jgi:hypothetical protein